VVSGIETETIADHYRPIRFACPVCATTYDTQLAAEVCRDRPFDDGGLKIGDIVVVPSKFHNMYEEDDPWVAFQIPPDPKSESHFDQTGYMVPYYVVTAIHSEWRDPHRCVVTLATLCDGELHTGWNPATGDGHCAMFRIDGGEHCDDGSNWIDVVRDFLTTCNPSGTLREEARALAGIRLSTRNLL
jgi:hypothetical protein